MASVGGQAPTVWLAAEGSPKASLGSILREVRRRSERFLSVSRESQPIGDHVTAHELTRAAFNIRGCVALIIAVTMTIGIYYLLAARALAA